MANPKGKSVVKKLDDQACFRHWFEQVYNEHFERLYRYAFSITKSKDLAEDVVEEVFVSIWERQNGHIEIKDLKNYLYVSTKHEAVRLVSKDPNRFLYTDYEEIIQIADTIDPETILMGNELQEIIAEAILSLPAHCALVYDMVKNQGKSYGEVSQELGISKKTVESHICKALAKLRKHLQQYFELSGPNIKRISGGLVILFSSLSFFC
jgi:RNA polymerase sigma-70 factor, ECF subfamily